MNLRINWQKKKKSDNLKFQVGKRTQLSFLLKTYNNDGTYFINEVKVKLCV